ncbi:DUF2267 domain-containing protein [Solwaraspora sp. WMMB335]|uniref:DUF2267 domain-containing protein n=1 Tax=Solwaraspora sp. WMMB335 TaxID=3404118 RepID=UPI003B9562EA
MAKQVEGDNRKRRALARDAREQGSSASKAGVSLGASKQPERVDRADRHGPPAAGAHKPGPRTELPRRPAAPAPPRPSRPTSDGDTASDPHVLRLRYRELVSEVSARTGLDFDQAKTTALATVATLARALGNDDRRRLLESLPAELSGEVPVVSDTDGTDTGRRPDDLAGFAHDVAALAGQFPEQAQQRAQAVLSAIADQDGDLIDNLALPPGLAGLTATAPPGGGLVGPDGQAAPLDDGQLRAAVRRLPGWTGDRNALSRILVLPADQLDRVLLRVDQLKRESGRGPRISRPDPQTAHIVIHTATAGAVTALDVDLAARVADAIDEARGGLA